MNALLVVGLVEARRYSLLSSMTCRRHSSAGISNGTPRTRLGGEVCRPGIPGPATP